MTVLTDCPQRWEGPLPHPSVWQRFALADLPLALQNLWRAIGTGDAGWRAEMVPAATTGNWSAVAFIEHAPCSQFDALQQRQYPSPVWPESVACLAWDGAGFHGQRNRLWAVERGNLHLSVSLTPRISAARAGVGFTMLPALAVLDALRRWVKPPHAMGLKWINDLWIDGTKVAGVLTSTQTEADRVERVILGIGLNRSKAPRIAPTPFMPAVACLAGILRERTPGLLELFWAVAAALERRYQQLLLHGLEPLYQDYQQFSLCLGQQVRIYAESVSTPAPDSLLARGILQSIRPDLSLVVEGYPAPLYHGRLAFEHLCKAWPSPEVARPW